MGLDTAPVGDTEIRAWGQGMFSIAPKNKRIFKILIFSTVTVVT